MRPRHKPGCTAFFHTPASGCPCFGLQTRPGWRPVVACRQSVGGFGYRLSPFPDGFRTRVAPVFGCPRSPTVSGRGLHRLPAVPVLRRFSDADCTGFRLSPFPDGFRTRIAPASGCPRPPTVFGCGLPLAGCSPAALFRLRPRLAPPSSGFAGSSRFVVVPDLKTL